MQMLFYRAFVAFAFNVIWLNRNLKKEMYTSVQRELVGQLAVKVVHSIILQFFLYTSVMYWPLTVTASARLAAPVLTIMLACVFLREFATKLELLYLAITLSGAIMIVIYSPISEEDQVRMQALGSASFLAYVYLFGDPFGMAVGQVLLRRLRKLSDMTVSCYQNLVTTIIFMLVAYLAGDDLLYFTEFSAFDWLALVSVSVLLVFAQNFYFQALANLPAPALQPLSFMSMIY